MRLLHTTTLELRELVSSAVPPYAILSHRWEDEEVTLDDMRKGTYENKKGFAKIKNCCEQARFDHYDYVWIDTCCIDKTSSSELSEAINSMYQWYKKSSVCYAYLSDVRPDEQLNADENEYDRLLLLESQGKLGDESGGSWIGIVKGAAEHFKASQWFKRGWTLQELIAPSKIIFFGQLDGDWYPIAEKFELIELLSECTGIDEWTLRGRDLQECSIAARMSWAANRETTREEDLAYCLLGLFDVNMPLLYGEGRKAFMRLQEEIMKSSDDQSLFAWSSDAHQPWSALTGLLALSPSQFQGSGAILPVPGYEMQTTYAMTNRGLRIELPLIDNSEDRNGRQCIAILQCQEPGRDLIGVNLACVTKKPSNQYARRDGESRGLATVPFHQLANAERKTIYIKQHLEVTPVKDAGVYTRVNIQRPERIAYVEESGYWRSFSLREDSRTPSGFQKGAVVFSRYFSTGLCSHTYVVVLFNVSSQHNQRRVCKVLTFNSTRDGMVRSTMPVEQEHALLSTPELLNHIKTKGPRHADGFINPHLWILRYLVENLHEVTTGPARPTQSRVRFRPPSRAPLERLFDKLDDACEKSISYLPNDCIVTAEIRHRFTWDKQTAILEIGLHDASRANFTARIYEIDSVEVKPKAPVEENSEDENSHGHKSRAILAGLNLPTGLISSMKRKVGWADERPDNQQYHHPSEIVAVTHQE